MNPDLDRLQPYPFEKLRQLFADLQPPQDKSPIALSIGEPKHPSPQFVVQSLADNLDKLANYPLTRGIPELRQAIADGGEEAKAQRVTEVGVEVEHEPTDTRELGAREVLRTHQVSHPDLVLTLEFHPELGLEPLVLAQPIEC